VPLIKGAPPHLKIKIIMALFIRIRPIDIGLKKSSAFPELPFPSAKVRIKE
jgi:hypothetical protein